MDVMNLFLLFAIMLGGYTYYAGLSAGPVMISLIVVAMLVLYVGGKQYLPENFTGVKSSDKLRSSENFANASGSFPEEAGPIPDIMGVSEATLVPRSREFLGGASGSDVMYEDEATGAVSDKPTESEIPLVDNELPYATTPILELADYDDPSSSGMLLGDLNPDETELDRIAAEEGERGSDVSRAIINKKVIDKQFEWSRNLPPSSIVQQIQQSKWNAGLNVSAAPFVDPKAGSAQTTEGFAGLKHQLNPKPALRTGEGFQSGSSATGKKTPYDDINASNLQPVDMDKLEAEERKILATYNPKKSKDMLEYDPDDVKKLLDKVYKVQGKKPHYYKRDDGVVEVYETTDLEPKIWYEGEEEPERADKDSGTNTVAVPSGVNQYASGLDPFFEPRQTTRPDRNDYTAWTPGLERMFAPTNPTEAWY
jgi:hypothetical protein